MFKTQDDERTISRQRRCKCGGRWYTDERVRKGSFVVITEPLVTTGSGSEQKSVSGSPSVSSGPLSNPDQTQTRVERQEPIVFAGFLLASGETWDLTESGDELLARAFPEIDRLEQYAKAAGWLGANPTKRKTPRGMPRFLFGWLERAVNRGTARPRNGTPPGGVAFSRGGSRTDGNVDELSQWLNRKGAA